MVQALAAGRPVALRRLVLNSARGWQVFAGGVRRPLMRRPTRPGMPPSWEEPGSCLRRAGIVGVRIHGPPNELIAAAGRKPGRLTRRRMRWGATFRAPRVGSTYRSAARNRNDGIECRLGLVGAVKKERIIRAAIHWVLVQP